MTPWHCRQARFAQLLVLALGAVAGLGAGTISFGETEQVSLLRVTVNHGDDSLVELRPSRTWIKGHVSVEVRQMSGRPLGNLEVALVPLPAGTSPPWPGRPEEFSAEESQLGNRLTLEAQSALRARTNHQGEAVFAPQNSGWYSLQLDWNQLEVESSLQVAVTFRQIKRAPALLPLIPALAL